MNKLKIIKPIVIAVLVIGIVAAVYILLKDEPQPVSDSTRPISDAQKAATYSCHYQDGTNYARCRDKSNDKIACYGYYDLRTSNIVDGIKVDYSDSGGKPSTCEGFSTRDNLFFDTDGNLVK